MTSWERMMSGRCRGGTQGDHGMQVGKKNNAWPENSDRKGGSWKQKLSFSGLTVWKNKRPPWKSAPPRKVFRTETNTRGPTAGWK